MDSDALLEDEDLLKPDVTSLRSELPFSPLTLAMMFGLF